MMIAAIVVGLAFGTVVVAALAGQRRFRERVKADVHDLLLEATVDAGPDPLRARWETLPEPVRRYLRFAVRRKNSQRASRSSSATISRYP